MPRRDPSDHRALYEQLQATLAGHSAEAVMKALVLSMASIAGFAAPTTTAGDELLDVMAKDAKHHLRLNWVYLQAVRAASAHPAGRA